MRRLRLVSLAALPAVLPLWGQGVWELRAPLPIQASEISITAIQDKAYAVCGSTADGPSRALFIYDPLLDVWSRGASIPITGGADHCNLARAGDKLYIVGAMRTGTSFVDGNTYEYDPAANRWRIVGAMKVPRGASGVAGIGATIYVMGGITADGKTVATVEAFDTFTGRWATLADMPTARNHLTAKALNQRVYAIGGRNGQDVNANEEFDPSKGVWTRRAPLPTARNGIASGAINNRIQVFGGAAHANEEYDPASDTWRTLAPGPASYYGCGAATVRGRIFAAGGGLGGEVGFSNANFTFILPPLDPPALSKLAVRNAATFDIPVAPGGLISIFGDRLSQGEAAHSSAPEAVRLNAVSVTVNGSPIPLVYVGPQQINAVLPLSTSTGLGEIVVTNVDSSTAPFAINVLDTAPGIFTLSGEGHGQGAILIAGTGLIARASKDAHSRQARRGEIVEIYCTGLGAVELTASESERARTTARAFVSIGGAAADVLFSGPAAGVPGFYQIDAVIPPKAAIGTAVPVLVQIDGGPLSNQVTMAIMSQ